MRQGQPKPSSSQAGGRPKSAEPSARQGKDQLTRRRRTRPHKVGERQPSRAHPSLRMHPSGGISVCTSGNQAWTRENAAARSAKYYAHRGKGRRCR
eukprot:14403443-Alexandrium_andersonii.AAC.1